MQGWRPNMVNSFGFFTMINDRRILIFVIQLLTIRAHYLEYSMVTGALRYLTSSNKTQKASCQSLKLIKNLILMRPSNRLSFNLMRCFRHRRERSNLQRSLWITRNKRVTRLCHLLTEPSIICSMVTLNSPNLMRIYRYLIST